MKTPAYSVLVNGVPESRLAVADRGLQYGDGLFETLAIRQGRPRFWDRHMTRLRDGCARLQIPAPDPVQMAEDAARLYAGIPNAVLKIIHTRGAGTRGYRPADSPVPTTIMQCLPDPDYPAEFAKNGIPVRICRMRLAHNPVLAGIKHLNRLEQVLARSEWNDDAIPEGLMADLNGNLIEGTMSNVFLVQGGVLLTPDLARCGVAGIMREVLLELSADNGIASAVRDVTLDELRAADELFVCSSLAGIWPVVRCDAYQYGIGPLTGKLQQLLGELQDNG